MTPILDTRLLTHARVDYDAITDTRLNARRGGARPPGQMIVACLACVLIVSAALIA